MKVCALLRVFVCAWFDVLPVSSDVGFRERVDIRDSLKGRLYPLGGWEPREFPRKLLGQKNPDSCGRIILF